MPTYTYRGKSPCRIGAQRVAYGDRVELPAAPSAAFEEVPVERPAAPIVRRPQLKTAAVEPAAE